MYATERERKRRCTHLLGGKERRGPAKVSIPVKPNSSGAVWQQQRSRIWCSERALLQADKSNPDGCLGTEVALLLAGRWTMDHGLEPDNLRGCAVMRKKLCSFVCLCV